MRGDDGVNSTDQEPVSGILTPSNLAVAILAAFLLVGVATDWKILRWRSSKPNYSVEFGGAELSHDRPASRSLRSHRSEPTGRAAPYSDIADRRGSNRESTIQPELD